MVDEAAGVLQGVVGGFQGAMTLLLLGWSIAIIIKGVAIVTTLAGMLCIC